MGTADRAVYALLFFVGWMSGGGILAMLSMAALCAIGATFPNGSFLSGCLWGTWGAVMGRWMGLQSLNNMCQQQGGADGACPEPTVRPRRSGSVC